MIKINKSLKLFGTLLGLAFVLIIIIIGILFITGVITFQISNVFFGWFLIIGILGLLVYSVIEIIILKVYGIPKI